MSDWLLKFGFGGVQEFISQARKTRDLAAGSMIISELAREALSCAHKDYGAEIILPHDPAGKWGACPHQVLIKLPSADVRTVTTCGEGMKKMVQSGWHGRARNALGSLKDLPLLAGESFLESEIRDSLEAYWVALPIDGGYEKARKWIQALFDDRRNTRTFAQLKDFPTPKKGWTCLQCGARVAVLDRERLTDFSKITHGLLQKRDRLCSVCLSKRAWSRSKFHEGFPSTIRLARDRLFRKPMRHRLDEALKDLSLSDSQILDLFDRWKEFEDPAPADEPKEDKKLRQAYQKLAEGEIRKDFERLSPYYAIAVFDGDHMGKWFSGELFKSNSLAVGEKALSGALGDFATKVKGFFPASSTPTSRKLIYAGGDDGLALLTLDDVVPFLRTLREAWDREVSNSPGINNVKKGSLPTFSATVGLVHEHAPLQHVVRRLHSDLEETKERAGRDAFSLRVDIRAGATAMMIAKWKEFDYVVKGLELLSNWRQADMSPPASGERPSDKKLQERSIGQLSARLPHSMLDAAQGYFDSEGACLMTKALGLELERVAFRSRGGWEKTQSNELKDFISWLLSRARAQDFAARPEGYVLLLGREAVTTALIVTAFLARELNWKVLS